MVLEDPGIGDLAPLDPTRPRPVSRGVIVATMSVDYYL